MFVIALDSLLEVMKSVTLNHAYLLAQRYRQNTKGLANKEDWKITMVACLK